MIYSEGAATESLYLGKQTLATLAPEAREELLALFPELLTGGVSVPSACFLPDPKQSRKLMTGLAQEKVVALQ